MSVEEAFYIVIADDEAEKVLTPGHLIDLVQAKVANVETEFCLSHRAFLLLRRFLMQHEGLSRRDIVPTRRLGELLPKERRAAFLQEFRDSIGTNLAPAMVAPAWLWWAVIGGTLTGAAATLALITHQLDFSSAVVFTFIVAFLLFALGLKLCRVYASEFPSGLSTVGGLALWIRSHKPDLASKSQRAWTREQIAARIREIVVTHLGCEKKYREDARFIQDLGLS